MTIIAMYITELRFKNHFIKFFLNNLQLINICKLQQRKYIIIYESKNYNIKY